jgi:hypothetical protein
VVPDANRIREVSENVAVAVVLAAQEQGVATVRVGKGAEEVRRVLRERMWVPKAEEGEGVAEGGRGAADEGGGAEGGEGNGAGGAADPGGGGPRARARSQSLADRATKAIVDGLREASAAVQSIADATTAARVQERTRALADAAIRLVEEGVQEANAAMRMVAEGEQTARVEEQTRLSAGTAARMVEEAGREAGAAVRMVEDSVRESAKSAPGHLRRVSDTFTRFAGAAAAFRQTGTVGGEPGSTAAADG